MIPLFWAKIEFGKELKTPEINEFTPSASTPPETRFRYPSPSIDFPDIIELAVISPVASIAVIEGMGFIIEKAFQDGGNLLREKGIRVESLAIIDNLDDCKITVR